MKVDLEAIVIIGGLGLLFGIFGFIDGLTLRGFLLGLSFGVFIGFAGLPYINDEKYSPMPVTCSVLGAVAGLVIGLERFDTTTSVILLTGAGVIVGYFAPSWAKYL